MVRGGWLCPKVDLTWNTRMYIHGPNPCPNHPDSVSIQNNSSRVVIFTAAYYVCDGVSLTIRKLRAHLRDKGIDSRVVSCGPEGTWPCGFESLFPLFSQQAWITS